MSDRLFKLQRDAFGRERCPALAVRRDRLARLMSLVVDNEAKFVAAVDRDFGGRSGHETRLAELYIVAAEIADARRHLARWMRPERVSTPLHLLPGRARIERQPVGVVGVISPWNYPVQLALAPVVGALAAGNRVLLKPSELTPATSTLLQELVAKSFAEDEFAVVLGDAEVGRAFTRLPFDHLFFTGSTAVGRAVALAAAENLTPVTLELGGKSPALVAPDADLALTAPRLMAGKLLNAGQTCIAPDYALVPRGKVEEFVRLFRETASRFYPRILDNPDYAAIINSRHYERLERLIGDARAKGARIETIDPAGELAGAHGSPQLRRMAPTAIADVTDAMTVAREEIFGPLLPIVAYDTLEDAIGYVNARPRPLALYYFDDNRTRIRHVLQNTVSGGVTINDTVYHFAQEELPFGGIGASGMGSYHGRDGFNTFSHAKGVFLQSRLTPTSLMTPPYDAWFQRIIRFLIRSHGG